VKQCRLPVSDSDDITAFDFFQFFVSDRIGFVFHDPPRKFKDLPLGGKWALNSKKQGT